MKKKEVNTQIPVIFQNMKSYENEDMRFLKIKIWLMHTGKNFNGSSFSKEVVNNHLHTLANTPILAFIEENSNGEKDFSDHRMVLHRTTDGGLELKYLGSAVGVIPENNNARWETRVTDSGEELEYLVADALMWTKWDDPIDIMKEKGFKSQSMELSDDYSGSWDQDGVFHFETFSFFGACLLGEDVLPAMKNSTAEIQFSKDEDLQNTIENKLQEFYTLFSQEGGNDMSEKTKQDETKAQAERTVLDMFTEAQYAEAHAMNTEFDNKSNPDNPDNTGGMEKTVDPDETGTGKGSTDFETKFNELNESHMALTTEHETLKEQLAELESYKRQREEDDLKAKFSGKLSEEEFSQVFTEMKDSDLKQVEERLFALIGKQNFSVQVTPKTNLNKLNIVLPDDDEKEQSPYGDIF